MYMGDVKMANDKSASRPSIQTLSQISWKEEILWTKLKSSSKRERLENNVTMKCEVAVQWEARQGEEDIILQ